MSITKKSFVVIVAIILVLLASVLFLQTAKDNNTQYVTQPEITTPLGANVSGSTVDNVVQPGDNLGVSTSGTQVSNQTQLENAIKANQNIVLTQDITLNSYTAPDVVYSGTIYGQGHTITINVSATTRITSGSNTNGYYGLLVRSLKGTIRDLKVSIKPQASTTYVGFALHMPQINIDYATSSLSRVQVIGGVIGKIDGGTVHNVKVTLENNTLVSSVNAEGTNSGNIYKGSDTRYYAGILAGHTYNGTISCVEVINNGTFTNLGQAKGVSTSGSFMSAIGAVSGMASGTTNLNRVSVGGSGYIKAEAHFYSPSFGESKATYHSINIAGGIIGYVHNGKTTINGVYLNYTSTNAVQSYYASTGSLSTWRVYQTASDDYRNDRYVSTNSSWNMYHALRASYGVGSVNISDTSMSNILSLRNVYMGSNMINNNVLDNHRYAAIGVKTSKVTGNAMVADAYKWKFTLVDNSAIGKFSFPIPKNASDVGNNEISPNQTIFTINNNNKSNFVYSVTLGEDTYNFADITYNKEGSINLKIGYIGFNGFNSSGDCVTGSTSPVSSDISDYAKQTWALTVNYGKWIYMDYDMLRAYNDSTTSTRSNYYNGSGTNYTYTYDGNRMYVPAFAGYESESGGGKVSFTAEDLDSILGGSIDIKLSSTSTINGDSYTEYTWESHRYAGAGNVGQYSMTYTKPEGNVFYTKNGNNYYCSFKDDYTINIQVLPYTANITWSGLDSLVYDATNKQLNYSLSHVSGNELGNNDSGKMALTLSYTCNDEGKLQNGLPMHAGEYTVNAQLSYDGSTANTKTGNYTLANASQAFNIQKRSITLQAGSVSSTYGDDHNGNAVANAGITLTNGSWASNDDDYFVFTTIANDVQFNSSVGNYVIDITYKTTEEASPYLAGDYEFNLAKGNLEITKKAITGQLTLNDGVYNGTNSYNAEFTVDGSAIVGGDSDVYSIKYQKNGESELLDSIINAGKYFVKIVINNENYKLGDILVGEELYQDGVTYVGIDKRSVDIDLSLAEDMVYSNASKVTGWQVSASQPENGGLVGEDTIDVSLNYQGKIYSTDTPIKPDVYTAQATSLNDNYVVGTIHNNNFEILRADLGIVINEDTFVFDGTQKNIGYTLVGNGESDLSELVGEVTVKYNSSADVPVNADSYNVEISVAEGSCYNSAVFTTYNDNNIVLTIQKAQMTITPDGVAEGNKVSDYNGLVQQISYNMSADGLSDQEEVKANTHVSYKKDEVEGFVKDAGVYQVTIAFDGTRNYEATQVQFVWTVNRVDLSIVYDEHATYTYNGNAQMPEFSFVTVIDGDSFGDITTSFTGETTNEQAVNAGTYTLNIEVAQSVNYNAFSTSIEFVIEKFALKLTEETSQYITLLEVDGVANTTILDYESFFNIILYDEANNNVANLLTKQYFADHSSAEEITNFTYAEGTDSKFSIKLSIDEPMQNYTFEGGWIDIVVVKANITIKVAIGEGQEEELQGNSIELTYGDAFKVSYTAEYNDVDQSQYLTVKWYKYNVVTSQWDEIDGSNLPVNAGRYQMVVTLPKTDNPSTIALSGENALAENIVIQKTMFVTIAPKNITATIDNKTFEYGQEINLGDFTNTNNSGIDNLKVVLDYTTNAQKFSNVGTYAINGSVVQVLVNDEDMSENYIVQVVAGNIDITKKTIYIKANDVEIEYGDEIKYNSFSMYLDADAVSVWEGDPSNPISVKLSVAQTGRLYVGNYDIVITPNASVANNNYDIQFTTTAGKLNVVARKITLTIGDMSVVYGSGDLSNVSGGNIQVAHGNLIGGDSLSAPNHSYIGETALNTLRVVDGGYNLSDYVATQITIMNGEEDVTANYEISYTPNAKLNILAKNITMVFNGWQSKDTLINADSVEYNAQNWSAKYTLDGVINGDNVGLNIVLNDTQELKNAGVFKIDFILDSGMGDNGNYTFARQSKTLTITPKSTVIQGFEPEYNYVYGDEKTAISASIATIDGDTDDGEFNIVYYVGDNTTATGTTIEWAEKWNAGKYTAVISYAGNNYVAEKAKVVIVVDKKVIGIDDVAGNVNTTFEFTYDTTNKVIAIDQILSETTSVYSEIADNLKVVYIENENVVNAIKNAGQYSVNIALDNNTNYKLAEGQTYLLTQPAVCTINKADASNLNFALSLFNAEYTGQDMADTIRQNIYVSGIGSETVKDGEIALSFTSESGESSQAINAGKYDIKLSFANSRNYKDISDVVLDEKFTIDQVMIMVESIKLDDKTFVYDTTTHSLTATGLPIGNAVYLGAEFTYDGQSVEGLVNATNTPSQVVLKVYFDKANAILSNNEQNVEEYQGKEAYVYTLQAEMTIQKAIPVLTTDITTTSYYYDGTERYLGFDIKGVGSDIADKNYTYKYSKEDGLDNITIDGLGTISIAYYKDKNYTDKLVGDNGAMFPSKVLLNNGKVSGYYMQIDFVSADPNYQDYTFKNISSEMILIILKSVITISFNNLEVDYGQLADRQQVLDYVNANMTYDFYVEDMTDVSGFDISSVVNIVYNVNSDITVNAGNISIIPSVTAIDSDSCNVILTDTSKLYLIIKPIDVTDQMVQDKFGEITSTYLDKVFNATNTVWAKPVGVLGEEVDYVLTYNDNDVFELSDAGTYEIKITIPQGNYNEWSMTSKITILPYSVNVEYSLNGQVAQDSTINTKFDGNPIVVEVSVVDEKVSEVPTVQYYNADGTLLDSAPINAGNYTVKAVFDNKNYIASESSSSIALVVEAGELKEETIKAWVKDKSDVYGSTTGLDLSGVPKDYATSVTYTDGTNTYDQTTVGNAKAGTYEATLTVNNGQVQGSATFVYTVNKLKVKVTANASTKFGVAPVKEGVSLSTNITLPNNDKVSLDSVVVKDGYDTSLQIGYYEMSKYFDSFTVVFANGNDNYDIELVMGNLAVMPEKTPEIQSATSNYNSITITLKAEGVYAYKTNYDAQWSFTTQATNVIVIENVDANKNYTVYVAYAEFTQEASEKNISTTYSPYELQKQIKALLDKGLTQEDKAEYDRLIALYEKVADVDKELVKSDYDELVNAYNNLTNPDKNGLTKSETVLIIIVSIAFVGAMAGLIMVIVRKKKKNNQNAQSQE